MTQPSAANKAHGEKSIAPAPEHSVDPDVAIPNPGRGTYKPLQLRIFKKLRVTEDLTLREVPVLSGNANSRLPKVPLQGFSSTPARFRYCFFCNWCVDLKIGKDFRSARRDVWG